MSEGKKVLQDRNNEREEQSKRFRQIKSERKRKR